MADESREHSASFELHTTSFSELATPPWLTEAIVALRALWACWLPLPLVERVRVERGRAGTFEVLDFVLVLLIYAVSGARTLKELYKQGTPFMSVLAGTWLRNAWPSRSALSRFLGDISPVAVEEMRTLF